MAGQMNGWTDGEDDAKIHSLRRCIKIRNESFFGALKVVGPKTFFILF